MNETKLLDSINKRLLALILVTNLNLEHNLSKDIKLEILLDKCGLSRDEIAITLNKSTEAVSKVIQRSKKQKNGK